MAKIVIAADMHFGVSGKLTDILWSARVIREYCKHAGIDVVIIAGDLFHDRKSLDIEVISKVCDFFVETKEQYNQQWIAFPGNHDMFLRHSWSINSLHIMHRYMTIVEDIKLLDIEDRRFWVLPFITYEKSFMRILDKVHEQHEDGDVLLTHVGVKGAVLNTCFLLKDWSIISFEDSPFERVYTGHFHSKQRVGHNVWYPGSPIPFKFDEGDVSHGFYVYDTDQNTHKFINIWKAGAKFFPDELAPPQFCTISDDDLNTLTEDDIQNNMVRIALSRDYTQNEKADIKDHLSKMGARVVRWLQINHKYEPTLSKPDNADKKVDLFSLYVEADEKGTKDLDIKILKRLNSEIKKEGDEIYSVESQEY